MLGNVGTCALDPEFEIYYIGIGFMDRRGTDTTL